MLLLEIKLARFYNVFSHHTRRNIKHRLFTSQSFGKKTGRNRQVLHQWGNPPQELPWASGGLRWKQDRAINDSLLIWSKPKTLDFNRALMNFGEHFNIMHNAQFISITIVLRLGSTWNPVMLHWALTQGHGIETLWQWRAQDVPGWIISYEPLAL